MKRAIAVLVGVPMLIVMAWHARSPPPPSPSMGDSSRTSAEASSAPHVQELRDEVNSLRRRLGATQSLALKQARRSSTTGDPTEGREERPSAEVLRRDVHRKLDGLLVTEAANRKDRQSSEAAVKGDLIPLLGTTARLTNVECGGTFCKVIIQEDGEDTHPPLDILALTMKSVSLRGETFFAYDNEGKRRRTTIYFAREGHLLPLPRADAPGG
jgi:hypothetical protein